MNSAPKIIWDVPTRLTHWAIALCVVLNLFVLEEGDQPHEWVGYAAVALVAFRLVWGLAGRAPSRFSSRGRELLQSLVYILIWLSVVGLGITGYMMGLDTFWGDEWLENLHARISTAVQILVVIHLSGVVFDSIRYRRKTWLGMIVGHRGER